MRLFRKGPVVFNASAVVRILHDTAEHIGREGQLFVTAHLDRDALRKGTGTDYRQVLREDFLVDEQHVGLGLLLGTASEPVHHRGRFRRRGRLIQQGTVGQRHGRQVTDYRLEVQQGLQTSLGDFRLIGGVGGVPHRILEHVALDDRRSHGVIPPASDVRLI